jgi:hypothetical protein
MSQLNVDALRHSTAPNGPGIDIASNGNVSFDTDTVFVDSVNDRVGVNTTSPTGSLHVVGTDGIRLAAQPLLEGVNIINGSSNSNTTIDVLTSSTVLYTSANTGNWTPNIRGDGSNSLNSIMNTGEVIVVTLISALGGSSGYAANMNIDGSGQTEYWYNEEQPDERGGTSGFDVYSYSIIKLGSGSWRVFASKNWHA